MQHQMKFRTVDIPQANTLRLVGDLIALIDAGITDKQQLSRALGLVIREVDYYKHAARIIGFLQLQNNKPVVSKKGQLYLQAKQPARKEAILFDAVRKSPLFFALLEKIEQSKLDKRHIVDFLKDASALTGTTLGRRADTIMSWVKALSKHPESYLSLAEHTAKASRDFFRRYRNGKEGFEHYTLKTRISQEPNRLLGEPLSLVTVEYLFPSNDRADILFVDSRAKFLAVEVEVDVGPLEIVGLLQAVKYRALLTVLFSRETSDVRGMLAARRIHPRIKDWASQYGIETREVTGVI